MKVMIVSLPLAIIPLFGPQLDHYVTSMALPITEIGFDFPFSMPSKSERHSRKSPR